MATNPSMQSDVNPFGYELNKEQWNFIFKYHPEYAASPYEMLIWIYQQALIKEEAEQAVMEQYGKPNTGGVNAGDSSEDEQPARRVRQLGNNNKQKNKNARN